MYGIIYKATNKLNGKIYIGQTINSLSDRKSKHYYSAKYNTSNNYFQRALTKYERCDFEWVILCKCKDLNDLNDKEMYYIDYYDTYNTGYNLTIGGDGSYGYKHSEETLQKMREKRKNYVCSEETKKKISEAISGDKNHFYGKKHSIETRLKMRESSLVSNKHATRGKPILPQTKAALLKANKERDYTIGSENKLAKKYIITTPEGYKFLVIGLKNFCRKYKKGSLDDRGFSSVATGSKKSYKGYKCRHYNEETDSHIKEYVY